MKAVKIIFRYLKGTKDRRITYNGLDLKNLFVKGYLDSNWVGDKESQKSISEFIFILKNGPVSWCSKKQSIVALSSIKVEYITLTLAAKKATWLKLLLTELGLPQLNQKHTLIKVSKKNTNVQSIQQNLHDERGRERAG